MADSTSKRLYSLLEPERPAELRSAALAVLGEIGSPEARLADLLRRSADDPDPAVRLQALAAIGKLRVDAALPLLLDRVRQGGPEAEAAAQAATRLGARGAAALRRLMAEVSPGLRRRIASALAAGETTSAETAALQVLFDADSNVIDAACRSLIAKVPTLDKAHRRRLADHVSELLKSSKRSELPQPTEAALLRVLAALEDPRSEAILWSRTDSACPPEIRAAAMQALGTSARTPSPDKIKRLIACAGDADFRVAAPALMILRGASLSVRSLADWLRLFQAADPAARRFAIEKLGALDRAEVARALVDQLDHPDRALREQAITQLAGTKTGRDALARTLLEAPDADRAWSLARAQAPFARDFPAALRGKLFEQACRHLDAGDRRADALLFLLRETDARDLRDRLEEKALALRKKKRYEEALTYLRLLARDPACGEGVRFELAGCGLKVSPHDVSGEARAADPPLAQFTSLLHRREIDLPDAIKKTKWLDPEDLFYLGFHFTEAPPGPEKEFGGQLLRLMIERSPRSKRAREAQNKLRRQGIK
jgi:hypothetical protein